MGSISPARIQLASNRVSFRHLLERAVAQFIPEPVCACYPHCDHASSCSACQSRRTQEHHLAQNRRVGRLGPRLVLGHFWHRRRPLAYDHAWTTPPDQRLVHTVLGSRCVPSNRYALAEGFSPQTFRQHPSHRRIIVRCRWQNRLAYRKPRSLAITLTQRLCPILALMPFPEA